jgi:hypothetical protein
MVQAQQQQRVRIGQSDEPWRGHRRLCHDLQGAWRPAPLSGHARGLSRALSGQRGALLADATVWAGRSESAQYDIFNLTNGDQFRWQYIWPRITRMFDMEIAEPVPTPPASYMTDKADLWASVIAKYCLQNIPYEKPVAWNFADFIFGSGFDNVSSPIKVRKADFNGCIDSEEMFQTFFHQLRAKKVIP